MKTMFKQLRNKSGKTLQQIHDFTGISINTLSLLDRGETKGIQFDTLLRLIDLFECTPNDFFGYYPGGQFNHLAVNVWAGDFDKRLGNPENTILQVIPTNEDQKFHVLYTNHKSDCED